MAFITLAGSLRDPNSDLSIGDQVRFTQQSTTGETLPGAVSVVTISVLGTYSVNLQYGLVLVEYRSAKNPNFKSLGIKTVNSNNPATSIPELLTATVPVSSADLIAFQTILADTVTTKNLAVVAESGAVTAKNAAVTARDVALAASIIQYQTFAELLAISETLDYKQFTVAERANAAYTLQPAGYVALAGDATLANGRVAELQIDGEADVMKFGAVKSLVTPSDAAFQRAFSRCNAVFADGEFALAGTFNITQSNKHLRGVGKLGTRINFLNETGDCLKLGSSTKTVNFSVSHLTIQRPSTASSGFNLSCINAEDVTIQDVELRLSYAGLNISGCKNVFISNITVFSGARTIKGLAGVRVGYSADQAMNGGKPTSIYMDSVDVETRGASGFSGFVDGFFYDSSDGIYMSKCHSFNVDNGLTINAGSGSGNFFVGLWAESCYFDKCFEHNVRFIGAASQYEDVTFSNCQFRAPAFTCAFMSANCTLKGLSFVAGTRFRKSGTGTLSLAPTAPIENLTIDSCLLQLCNDSSSASVGDVRIHANGFHYTNNKHDGNVASGTCLVIIAGSDNFIVGQNIFTKSSASTKINDASGAVDKLIVNNLI